MTQGRTRVKITLAGSLVYYFTAWVGKLAGQDAILGIDVIVPAGIRPDLSHGTLIIGMWLAEDKVPRRPGYVTIGSRRYIEWQNLAFQATTYLVSEEEEVEEDQTPMEAKPEYRTPSRILTRSRPSPDPAERIGRNIAPIAELVLPTPTKTDERQDQMKGQGRVTCAVTSNAGLMNKIIPDRPVRLVRIRK